MGHKIDFLCESSDLKVLRDEGLAVSREVSEEL